MRLRRLELQGFKTFANRTVLDFVPDPTGRGGVTGVVGPNGSGKSNVADGIRWVMGEQSMKLLRGKKSEDVIFSGSDKKSRSGFAEVTLILEREEGDEVTEGVEASEIAITRRLYRDGQSEYEVNKQAARLSDVALLLAQCGIGQRTYSVIGQGMVDAVLVASPAERKEFFDEAAGLKPFQLKRQQAMNKLGATRDNLRQAELLLQEIGPRLSSLERQAKRLMEREKIEEELKTVERAYYGGTWAVLRKELNAAEARTRAAESERAQRAGEAEKLEAELATLEKSTPPSEGFREIRASLDALAEERAKLRERQVRLEASKEVAAVRAEKPWSPLPLSKIIEAIEELHGKQEKLLKLLLVDAPDIGSAKKLAQELKDASEDLTTKLQRPAPEPTKAQEADPKLEKEVKELLDEMHSVQSRIEETQKQLEDWNKNEEGKRTHIFDLQHKLTAARRDQQSADARVSEAAVMSARLETRRDGFLLDLRANAPALEADLEAHADAVADNHGTEAPESFQTRLHKLRSQLEWIGGIDPEVLKEYETTKARHDELQANTLDLTQALASLDTIIAELDGTIKERARKAFTILDREFSTYFKKLFAGGEARLIEVAPEPEVDEEGNITVPVSEDAGPAGIDIQATPPGKRLKSIALLSGGERALTSIALICAIMATNPSPFIVLDEVDAALDESNSKKYADILQTLADKTQFVVITHNRATMHTANVLYGVTMGEDGVSQLLSVNLHDGTS
jgi:chromosome segregation ATPase